MKKFLLLSLTFLVTLCINATAFSQTKEQTTVWLNKYGERILNRYYEDTEAIGFKEHARPGLAAHLGIDSVDTSLEVAASGDVLIKNSVRVDYSDSLQTITYAFNLKNIDPAAIEVSDAYFILKCSIGTCISIQKEGVKHKARKDSVLQLYAGNMKIPYNTVINILNHKPKIERFVKMLKHAIALLI